MALKNYTTQIKVEKTLMEIEHILSRAGATKILKDYDGGGNVTSLSFMVATPHGMMPIQLPMRVREVSQILQNDGKLPLRLRDDINHARRVGWRIIKDWVDAQMALLATHMVQVHEVFLPFAYDAKNNETLFQRYDREGYGGLLEDRTQ